ncbi:hypothetical protein BSNK01_15300 [Bacillaceae bacterium]
MRQGMAAVKRRDAEVRIPVLRMEIDYALATLYEAMQANDEKKIRECKEMLERFRREWLMLEA